VVVVIGGLVFRSTAPDNDVIDIEVVSEPQVVEEARGGGGQLLMLGPEGLPPAEGVVDTTAEKTGAAGDKSKQKAAVEQVSGEPTAFEVISITDAGFVPDKLTVKAGTQVTFMNNGQALHWPASDNHPLHRLLPGFDAKKGLTTGEEYAFTFNKTGEWTYHDNLLPNLTGVVIVTSN